MIVKAIWPIVDKIIRIVMYPTVIFLGACIYIILIPFMAATLCFSPPIFAYAFIAIISGSICVTTYIEQTCDSITARVNYNY